MPILEILAVGGLIAGGIASLVGSYWEGEIAEEQFDREMEFRERELAEKIKMEARRMGIQEKELQSRWKQFIVELKENKRQFEETMGFKRETLKHQKFMDVIKPALDQNKRSKNLIQAFSNMKKGISTQAPGAGRPVNMLTTTAPTAPAAPAAPAAPTNPLTQ